MITRFYTLFNNIANSNVLQRCYNHANKTKKQFISPRKKNIQRKLEKLRLTIKSQPNENQTPIITTKRKEYNFYVGDNFNKFEPILITQGWHHKKSNMDYFTIHPIKNKFIDDIECVPFKELNFSKHFIDNLKTYNLEVPTIIQMKAFPKLMEGFHTIIAAETGTGKTLAYLLPLVNQIEHYKTLADEHLNSPIGLIITPSRELALQIQKELIKLITGTNIKTKLIIGGRVKKMMRNPPVGKVDILISTLGALSKFVTNHVYNLEFLKHVILDEADSLFHNTFHEKLIPFLQKINFVNNSEMENHMSNIETGAQLTLVSATMPTNVSNVLNTILNVNSFVTASTTNLHIISVPQKFIRVRKSQKPMLLLKLIKDKSKRNESFIIFTNKTETCNWLSNFLYEFNVKNISLNAKLPEKVRRYKFDEFNNEQINVLCTTDAGSRGLDTIQVREVINYDFPLQTAEYIHRCGRTGRVGSPKNCKVTNFISLPLEIILARKIEIATKKGLPIPIIDMYQSHEIEEHNNLIDKMINLKESEMFTTEPDDEFNEDIEEHREDKFPY